jgi:hypothetical protein
MKSPVANNMYAVFQGEAVTNATRNNQVIVIHWNIEMEKVSCLSLIFKLFMYCIQVAESNN